MAHYYRMLITVGNGNVGFSFPQPMAKAANLEAGEEIVLILDENSPEEIKILRKGKLDQFKEKLNEIDSKAMGD